jgi:hypothetical protein
MPLFRLAAEKLFASENAATRQTIVDELHRWAQHLGLDPDDEQAIYTEVALLAPPDGNGAGYYDPAEAARIIREMEMKSPHACGPDAVDVSVRALATGRPHVTDAKLRSGPCYGHQFGFDALRGALEDGKQLRGAKGEDDVLAR